MPKEDQCDKDAHTADPKGEPVLLGSLGYHAYCTTQNPNTEKDFHASPDGVQPPGTRTLIRMLNLLKLVHKLHSRLLVHV